MRQFNIFRHPDRSLIAIKEGFAWPGAIFGCFWLFYHRLYGLGTAAFCVGGLFYTVFPSRGFGAADVVNIGICIVVGVLGNMWRTDQMAKRGFELVDTVIAESPDGASAAYLRSHSEDGRNVALGRREPTL